MTALAHGILVGQTPHMGPGDPQVRRDARTVEIAVAVLLGGLIAVVPNVALWLAGLAVGVEDPGWDSTRQTVLIATIVIGVAVAAGWLFRARRRGL